MSTDDLISCPYCEKQCNKYGIKTHIWRAHGEGKNHDPNRGYKTDRKAWNKGLTKHDSEGLAEMSRKLCGKLSWLSGKTALNDSRVQLLADNVSKRVREKIDNGTWHIPKRKRISYVLRGIELHGTWELRFAKFLDCHNVPWVRPTEKFQYTFQNRIHNYTPDFYLPITDTFVEVKGYAWEKDFAKWSQFPVNLIVLRREHLSLLGIFDD